MAEEKRIKGRKKHALPAADSFSKKDASGWMFLHINEGWLRKRWRKRYCVLSNGILYFYEQESSDGTEKNSCSINTQSFQDCVKASRKDCKKSLHTFILEPDKGKYETAKDHSQVTREMFYTETEDELDTWIAALKEAINLCKIGSKSTLEHITKSRARPPRGNGGRRRPTKQHLKERGMMSEIDDDLPSPQDKGPSKKEDQGRKRLVALKPGSANAANLQKTKDKKAKDLKILSQKSHPNAALPKPPPASLKPSAKSTENADVVIQPKDNGVNSSGNPNDDDSEHLTDHQTDLSDVSPALRLLPSSSFAGEALARPFSLCIMEKKDSPQNGRIRPKSMPVALNNSEQNKIHEMTLSTQDKCENLGLPSGNTN